MPIRLLSIWIAFSAVFASPEVLSAEGFFVGTGRSDITPAFPIRLTGYGSRQLESEGVEQKIYARSLAIREKPDSPPAVICAVELLGITPEIRQAVLREVNKSQTLANERFVLTATHTHTGPCVNGVCPLILGDTIRPDQEERIDRYSKELVGKIAGAVVESLAKQQTASLSYAKGEVGFAVNRRVLKEGTWAGFGVNADGPVDRQLPLLIARDSQGKVIAVLANYACHCTTFGGRFNKIAGDWAGYASAAIEREYPEATALITIGCGADANPEPRDGENVVDIATKHGEDLAKEVQRLIGGELEPIEGEIAGKIATTKLPYDRARTKEEWESLAKQRNQTGVYGKYFLDKFNQSAIPTELDYTISTLTFGDDLAMVFLAGEVVVDYSIRLHEEFDAERVWVTAYANDVPCYIPSRRVLRERGYEADRSMEFYRRPNRLSPAVEDLIVDTVQKLLPPRFYSEDKQAEFPPPKSPEDAMGTFSLPEGLKLELVAAEPLVVDPVAFDWGMDGSLWVVEMGDYPDGVDGQGKPGGRVKKLTDQDGDGVYDHADVFLSELPFPTGVKVWRDGVLVTAAPKILFAQDTTGDGKADKIKTLYEGFGEGNQQHRVNGLRWGLDNWLYVGNGDSDGEIKSTKTGETVNVRKRDLRIRPETGQMEAISGNTQFGISRDDWGNWFGGNNSNPMWHYVLNQRYLDRNPHVVPPEARVMVSETPGAAPVFPTSRTLGRYNDFYAANRFTSACSPIVYRDDLLGEDYAGNSFVCEPVHNLVHREIMYRDGVRFKSRRAKSEQASEFLASDDNWFRPAMIRTGPDGALWVADMYRFVIEHPKWIPEHQQRKVDVRAGQDRGRIYRIVPESGVRPLPKLNGPSTEELVDILNSPNGTLRDMAHQLLYWTQDPKAIEPLEKLIAESPSPKARLHALCVLDGMAALDDERLAKSLQDPDPRVVRHTVRISETLIDESRDIAGRWLDLAETKDPLLKMQLAYSLGEWKSPASGKPLAKILLSSKGDPYLTAAAVSSLHEKNLEAVVDACLKHGKPGSMPAFIEPLLQTALGHKRGDLVERVVLAVLPNPRSITAEEFQIGQKLLSGLSSQRARANELLAGQTELQKRLESYNRAALDLALNEKAKPGERAFAVRFLGMGFGRSSKSSEQLSSLVRLTTPTEIQIAVVEALSQTGGEEAFAGFFSSWNRLTPAVKKAVIAGAERSSSRQLQLLRAIEQGGIASLELDVSLRQRLLDHRDSKIRNLAKKVLGETASREEILETRADALQLAGDAVRGKPLFKKHCSGCHKVGQMGFEVGPDLNSLTNRSPQALFAAILDPNRAVEDKYTQYTAITTEGLTHTGQLVNETANSITLEAAEKKRVELLRSQLEEFRSTGKSLMPEGLEKVLESQDLSDIIAFVSELGPEPKTFPGLSPRKIVQENGPIRLPASAAFLFGEKIGFNQKYQNLESWGHPTDRAVWKVHVTRAGTYQIALDYACDPLHANNRFRATVGNQTIDAVTNSTGSWDHFQVQTIGSVDLAAGMTIIQVQSIGPIRRESLMKLRSIELR